MAYVDKLRASEYLTDGDPIEYVKKMKVCIERELKKMGLRAKVTIKHGNIVVRAMSTRDVSRINSALNEIEEICGL